jgi:hypothetical protein
MKRLFITLILSAISFSAIATPITKVESDDLIFMVEEEKLAMDVYNTLAKSYNSPVFINIPNSEQKHIKAISSLLAKYNIVNPIDGMGVGEFKNIELSNLYRDLINKGQTNLTNALLVGALIEEKDMIDLKLSIQKTTKEDLLGVYAQLMCGSRNHLRAFVRNYTMETGNNYQAQLMTAEDVLEIINSVHEQCGQH